MASTILKLGQKIRKWRNLAGFKTQYKFWRLVNPEIKSSHVSAYESPNSKEDVPLKYLPDVARVLKVPIELLRDPNVQDYPQSLDPWIIYKSKPVADLLPHERLIPVLSKISPDGVYAPADVSASEVLPPTIQEGILGDFFALPMRGDSMSPTIPAGAIIIFKKFTSLNPDYPLSIINSQLDSAVFLVSCKNELLIKQIRIPETGAGIPPSIILESLNPDRAIFPRRVIPQSDFPSLSLIARAISFRVALEKG